MNEMRVVGCFIEYGGKFIILHRRPDKSQGDTWGLPAGKVETGESDLNSMIREIKEETGYTAKESEIEFLGEWRWDYPEQSLIVPVYRIKLKNYIQVIHQPDEHLGFKWVTPEECYVMNNLVPGFHDLLELVGYVKK